MQLVSTFGLAVFLVLYYVLVIRVEENRRYESLRDAVNSLMVIIEKGATLLPEEQTRRLESIYVEVACGDLAGPLHAALQGAPTREGLSRLTKETLVGRTSLLQGFSRRDGRGLAELLVARIQNSGLPDHLADQALDRWKTIDRDTIERECRQAVERELFFLATAK
ncbi:MAG: hypothetical protein L0323_00700 [Planctomycetes bacterium]|nr:hypothetical protein [Planctomycetota bacterium]